MESIALLAFFKRPFSLERSFRSSDIFLSRLESSELMLFRSTAPELESWSVLPPIWEMLSMLSNWSYKKLVLKLTLDWTSELSGTGVKLPLKG